MGRNQGTSQTAGRSRWFPLSRQTKQKRSPLLTHPLWQMQYCARHAFGRRKSSLESCPPQTGENECGALLTERLTLLGKSGILFALFLQPPATKYTEPNNTQKHAKTNNLPRTVQISLPLANTILPAPPVAVVEPDLALFCRSR